MSKFQVLAEATRGGAVESVHHGAIAVVDVSGTLVASAGDPSLFAYFRSSGKPFQAIPVVESGAADEFGFTPAELALCCASHHAEPHHQTEVAAMLAKLGLDDTALQCGIPLPSDEEEAGRILAGLVKRSPLQCDCSGKHSGMLATCLHLGYPIDRYLEPDHPVQQTIRAIVAEMCRVAPEELRPATDGCSVPTFGAPLQAFATAYSSLAAPESIPNGAGSRHSGAMLRLRNAMTSHPDNVSGKDSLVTNLMSVSNGAIVAKTGAEGLICLAIPEKRFGIAIRIADGSFRTHEVVVPSVLRQLEAVDSSVIDAIVKLHDPAIRNHNNRHVGDLRAVFNLQLE